MTEDTLTAPNGFLFDSGEQGLRHIPVEESDIKAPYTKQNCFGGMGECSEGEPWEQARK